MNTIPCVIDVDTGFDDALALLLALRSPALKVLGITCVVGNQRVPQVVLNTLQIVELTGREEIPVAAGMQLPLIETLRTPLLLHGRDGMADLDLPQPSVRASNQHAVELIAATVRASSDQVELIALGPLTNIAVFVRMYPELLAKLSGITIMGGTFTDVGNTSPVAEFNFRHDPEAAYMVLHCGAPIRLYPLDVFRKVAFPISEINQLARSSLPALSVAGRILLHSCRYFKSDTALIGDAGAVATLIAPDLCQVSPATVTVELTGHSTRGQLIVDHRNITDGSGLEEWWSPTCVTIDVITEVDAAGCCDLFVRTVGSR